MIDKNEVYVLVRCYPKRMIGDLAIYDPNVIDSNFIWLDTSKVIPEDFQPDIVSWFRKYSQELVDEYWNKERIKIHSPEIVRVYGETYSHLRDYIDSSGWYVSNSRYQEVKDEAYARISQSPHDFFSSGTSLVNEYVHAIRPKSLAHVSNPPFQY